MVTNKRYIHIPTEPSAAPPVVVPPLLSAVACGIESPILPEASDDYELTALGPPDPTHTMYTIANKSIAYTINGLSWTSGTSSGALGDGYLEQFGFRFDPNGLGYYGVDDYITPGTPWEGYVLIVGSDIISGSNSDDVDVNAKTWRLAPNNVLSVIGDKATKGLCTCQYSSIGNEPVIRIRMSYTNTTAVAKSVKMLRGVDPDVDVLSHGEYDTLNARGLSSIPATDIAVAIGQNTQKPLAIYAPGNGFTHNTGILEDWPAYDATQVDLMLAGTIGTNSIADDAICAAWDVGLVEPGESVSVCVFYICSNSAAEVLDLIQGSNVPGAPTITSAAQSSSGEVTLVITPPTSDGGSPITDYVVEYKRLSGTTHDWLVFSDGISTSTTIVVTGLSLDPYVQWSFRVKAVNINGSGPYSASVNAETYNS